MTGHEMNKWMKNVWMGGRMGEWVILEFQSRKALKGEVLPYIRHEADTTMTQCNREKRKMQ
jgi:hypothetical protein